MPHCPIEVLTPPAAEPVTLAELKNAIRTNTGTAEDADLTGYLVAAREQFELETGRAVMPTTFRQWLPGLGRITLRRGKVLSLVQVKYYDQADVLQTLTGLELDAAGIPAEVYLQSGAYPATRSTRLRPAYVDFIAGWPNAAAVPLSVKTAIKLLAAHYYANREAYTEGQLVELPRGFTYVCGLWDTGLTKGG